MKKRVSDEQIYHLNGLSMKRRRRRKRLVTERLPLLRPDAPNLTWSMDLSWMHWPPVIGSRAFFVRVCTKPAKLIAEER